jgi:hypothetical protein
LDCGTPSHPFSPNPHPIAFSVIAAMQIEWEWILTSRLYDDLLEEENEVMQEAFRRLSPEKGIPHSNCSTNVALLNYLAINGSSQKSPSPGSCTRLTLFKTSRIDLQLWIKSRPNLRSDWKWILLFLRRSRRICCEESCWSLIE